MKAKSTRHETENPIKVLNNVPFVSSERALLDRIEAVAKVGYQGPGTGKGFETLVWHFLN